MKYGLDLVKYDSQYVDCIIQRNSKEEIILLADKIICTFGKKGLMEELNNMQMECMGCPVFENKFEIPLYFINLILERYNMEIIKLFEKEV